MRFSQTPSPLMDAFFSDSNQDQIQKSIISNVNLTSGYTIQRQNPNDLLALMGKSYTDLRGDTEKNIDGQVSAMNQNVVTNAVRMIISGIKMDLQYLNDIANYPVPLELPKNTSIYGTNMNRSSV